MNLRQYNEILWACIGTLAILGAVGLALVLVGSGLFSDRFPDPQVDLREPEAGANAPDRNLVLCLPTIISASNTYLIGATIADASEPVSKDLRRAAMDAFPEEAAARFVELNRKQQREGLTDEEIRALDDLRRGYERVMVVRAEAAALLKQRGHDVSKLILRG